MIKELTIQEITTCHGGVNIVARTHGKGDSVFIATMAAVGTLVILDGYAGPIVTALSIPVVLITTYYSVVGTNYTVDLDATAIDN